jgi:hypothetical protein
MTKKGFLPIAWLCLKGKGIAFVIINRSFLQLHKKRTIYP